MPKSILDEVHDLESFTEYISDNLSEGTKLNFEVVFRNFDNFCIAKYGGQGMKTIVSEMQKSDINKTWNVLRAWIAHETKRGIDPATLRLRYSLLSQYMHWMSIGFSNMPKKFVIPRGNFVKSLYDFFRNLIKWFLETCWTTLFQQGSGQ